MRGAVERRGDRLLASRQAGAQRAHWGVRQPAVGRMLDRLDIQDDGACQVDQVVGAAGEEGWAAICSDPSRSQVGGRDERWRNRCGRAERGIVEHGELFAYGVVGRLGRQALAATHGVSADGTFSSAVRRRRRWMPLMISTRSTGFDIGVHLDLNAATRGYAACPIELEAASIDDENRLYDELRQCIV